jgi:tetratricopeptide (TPR) repeat protein
MNKNRIDEALNLFNERAKICRELGLKLPLCETLSYQVHLLNNKGLFEEAMALHTEIDALYRELNNKDRWAKSLLAHAVMLETKGLEQIFAPQSDSWLNEALELYKEAETIYIELENKESIAMCVNKQALVFDALYKFEEAIEQYKRAENIYIELHQVSGLLAENIYNQGRLLYLQNPQNPNALKRLEEAQNIANKSGAYELYEQLSSIISQIKIS